MKPLFGLALSGGKSSRMGKDKGGLRYHGVAQADYLYALLSRYCRQVFVSIRDEQRSERLYRDFPVIVDEGADIGPMGGLVAAFNRHADVAWLLVAIDLPNVSAETCEALIGARGAGQFPRGAERYSAAAGRYSSAPDAFAFLNPEIDAPDPMCAIYEASIVPLLRRHIERGRYGLRRVLERAATRVLDPIDAGQFDNVNTPREYAAALGTMGTMNAMNKNNELILEDSYESN